MEEYLEILDNPGPLVDVIGFSSGIELVRRNVLYHEHGRHQYLRDIEFSCLFLLNVTHADSS